MSNSVTNRKAGIPQGIIIAGVSILPMMAVITLMPVIPTIRNHFSDIPYINVLAPLVISAPGLCVALFAPYAGFLTDKLGRRKLLLVFTFLYGLGGILPFFVENFALLIGSRLILGIGEAFILTVSNALLGDYFEENKRNTWIMLQSMIGPAFGFFIISGSGYLASIGWQYPFLLYSFTFFITIGAYFFIYEPTKKVISEADKLKNFENDKFPMKLILKVALTTFIASVLYYVYTLQFSLALDEIGITDPKKVGNITAVASLMLPLGAIVFKLIGKKSNRLQFMLMFTLIGIGLIGIGLSDSLNMVWASAIVQQFGCGMAIPVLIAYGLRSVPVKFRGRGMGFWSSGFFLGLFLSPFIVGAVSGVVGGLLPAFVIFGVTCIVLAGINWFFSTGKPQVAA
ncbi:MFS transporter [Confluentibacter flavum]|uniref:MFS transporter n=1 Tax=Confluentibacter flavum TaxID=1909700 RepID=A0A2N3HHW2_9FLAO|nr:MFS transporter [Confluentibacter flavum]PKQ44541.1 MFS transporter [Confluentibacter flavum]